MPSRTVDRALPALAVLVAVLVAVLAGVAAAGVALGWPLLTLLALAGQLLAAACLGMAARALRRDVTALPAPVAGGTADEPDGPARDELTGLTTRTDFFRQASLATAVAGPANQAAILFCDLDGFDGVNGVYGRAAGDEVLRSVAARLQRALRPHELIGRIGGDEFGVLLPAPVERKDADLVAARLQAAVAAAITLRGEDAVHVPMNIVVAIVDQPTTDAETVVPQSNRTASKLLTPLP